MILLLIPVIWIAILITGHIKKNKEENIIYQRDGFKIFKDGTWADGNIDFIFQLMFAVITTILIAVVALSVIFSPQCFINSKKEYKKIAQSYCNPKTIERKQNEFKCRSNKELLCIQREKRNAYKHKILSFLFTFEPLTPKKILEIKPIE